MFHSLNFWMSYGTVVNVKRYVFYDQIYVQIIFFLNKIAMGYDGLSIILLFTNGHLLVFMRKYSSYNEEWEFEKL